jgi:hypothetical protein
MPSLEELLKKGKKILKRSLGIAAISTSLLLPTVSRGETITLNVGGQTNWVEEVQMNMIERGQTGKIIYSENKPVNFFSSRNDKNEISFGYGPMGDEKDNPPMGVNNTETKVYFFIRGGEFRQGGQKARYLERGKEKIVELKPMEETKYARLIYRFGQEVDDIIREKDPTRAISEVPIVNLFVKGGFIDWIEGRYAQDRKKDLENLSSQGQYNVEEIPLWPIDANPIQLLGIREVQRGFFGKIIPDKNYTGENITYGAFIRLATKGSTDMQSGKIEVLAMGGVIPNPGNKPQEEIYPIAFRDTTQREVFTLICIENNRTAVFFGKQGLGKCYGRYERTPKGYQFSPSSKIMEMYKLEKVNIEYENEEWKVKLVPSEENNLKDPINYRVSKVTSLEEGLAVFSYLMDNAEWGKNPTKIGRIKKEQDIILEQFKNAKQDYLRMHPLGDD